MGSYLWVLKYVLQPQNVGTGLIRSVFLQGVQQLFPRTCMQDPPAWSLLHGSRNCNSVCAASIYFILLNIASLNAGCIGKRSFGLG